MDIWTALLSAASGSTLAGFSSANGSGEVVITGGGGGGAVFGTGGLADDDEVGGDTICQVGSGTTGLRLSLMWIGDFSSSVHSGDSRIRLDLSGVNGESCLLDGFLLNLETNWRRSGETSLVIR